MDEKQIKEVFSDEAFLMELFKLDEPGEVQAVLKEKGVAMSESEIIELRDAIVKLAEQSADGGELSLEQLEEAAGGFASPTVLGVLGAIVLAGVGVSIFGALVSTVGAGIGITAISIDAFTKRRW